MKGNVMVTGGQSMIGRQVVSLLREKGYFVDPVPHSECDLTQEGPICERFEMVEPDYVIHLAGYNGGIAWNKKHPERIFRRTVRMGMNVLEAASLHDVKKVISIISSCAYPDMGEIMMHEFDFWSGESNESVECHGLAKRFLHAYSKQLNKDEAIKGQYICAVVNNSYGPWDSFHPFKTKVVAALIKKFVEAKRDGLNSVECWGTGLPRREFIYCKDVARALVLIMENESEVDLMNVGSGVDYSIKELTDKIAQLVGYEGEITWDSSKPDGQMRKMLNSKYFQKSHGFKPEYNLEQGLKETIDWYTSNKEEADERCAL